MSATAEELENDIAQMEDRLVNVKVAVDVEREAWRRSSKTGKRGTKWKGAAPSRKKQQEQVSATSENNVGGEDDSGDFTVMPMYWDALELAQYLQAKNLTYYAQIVVYEQITGKILLDTPVTKLRKLFEEVAPSANDPNWKVFQSECSKLQRQQRRLDKAISSGQLQPHSARSVDSTGREHPTPSAVINAAGAALVFPLISPRLPGLPSAMPTQALQPSEPKPTTASRPNLHMRKPASSNNVPMATCWNCKARFFRPRVKRPTGGRSNLDSNQPVSSSMRASLLARAYCSKACEESIESSDIRVSPSLSARVKVTFCSSNTPAEDKPKRPRLSRIATGLASVPTPSEPQRDGFASSGGIVVGLVGGGKGDGSPKKMANRNLRKTNTFARRLSKPNASLNGGDSFDFLHVATPRRETAAIESPPRREQGENYLSSAMAYASRRSSRPMDAASAAAALSLCASITSITINSGRPSGAAVDRSPTKSSTLALSNPGFQGALNQSKTFQQSTYKLDPDIFQAHEETFSSCFGATALNNRVYSSAPAWGTLHGLDPGRGNLLRLTEFLSVRALHRLSLTCRAWFNLVTVPSIYSDALWGSQVLRIWRPSEEDDAFLLDVGVLKKPERPRRMLQLLTRQVARVVVENMKILLNIDTWQLATVMAPVDEQSVQSLHRTIATLRDGGELSPRPVGQARHLPAELYEQITVIYTRAGEVVAVCARQLIRPVDPLALLTDILQGLKSGGLLRVHCRRLRLFSETNRLPFDQWAPLPSCSRTVVEFFWSSAGTEAAAAPPLALPAWHQKILSKLQLSLQQRLLGKDSVQQVIKLAHDQNVPTHALTALEKFLARSHTRHH